MAFSNRALLASRARLAAFRPQAFSAGAVARFSTYKEDPNQLQSKRKQYMFKTAAEYHHEDTTDHHHHHHEVCSHHHHHHHHPPSLPVPSFWSPSWSGEDALVTCLNAFGS